MESLVSLLPRYNGGVIVDYQVVLIQTEEGISVSCPALKGCHSQGKVKAEVLENIRNAIREWLASENAEKSVFSVTEEQVTV